MSEKERDHKAEALDGLKTGDMEFDRGSFTAASFHQRKALVHSNLAITEGQERMVEELRLLRTVHETATGKTAVLARERFLA